MSHAIDDLRHEHEVIGHALKILAAMSGRLLTGKPAQAEDLQGIVAFLKEFADKRHHGKEEGLLFPALVEAGVAMQGGPVGQMLLEHVQGRHWIAAMDAALQPDLQAAEFAVAAQGYTNLLTAHIEKENQVLFPLAERLLPEARLQALFDAFEAHDGKVMGAGRHQQLLALLGSWKAKYLG